MGLKSLRQSLLSKRKNKKGGAGMSALTLRINYSFYRYNSTAEDKRRWQVFIHFNWDNIEFIFSVVWLGTLGNLYTFIFERIWGKKEDASASERSTLPASASRYQSLPLATLWIWGLAFFSYPCGSTLRKYLSFRVPSIRQVLWTWGIILTPGWYNSASDLASF